MSHTTFAGAASFEIVSQGRALPLFYGATFTRDQFPMLVPSAGGGPVAQVSANPNDPSQLGLQNLTAQPWAAVMPDGSQQQVEPGRSARLADGVSLHMGGVQCDIRAAQPAVQPAQSGFPLPPFGQQQAPAFGQQPVGGGWMPPTGGPVGGMAMSANDSGTGKTAVLPPELKGFNRGACIFTFIWAIANKTPIGLLALIPVVGLVMMFVLGRKGNEWAWQNRRWDSIQQFQEVQQKWDNAVRILILVLIVLRVVLRFVLPDSSSH